jgi:hypothetical protein
MYGLWCYSVVVTDSIDKEVIDAIKSNDNPKHWSSSETIAVYNLENNTLYHSETNPMWGSMYHELRRQVIKQQLSV